MAVQSVAPGTHLAKSHHIGVSAQTTGEPRIIFPTWPILPPSYTLSTPGRCNIHHAVHLSCLFHESLVRAWSPAALAFFTTSSARLPLTHASHACALDPLPCHTHRGERGRMSIWSPMRVTAMARNCSTRGSSMQSCGGPFACERRWKLPAPQANDRRPQGRRARAASGD